MFAALFGSLIYISSEYFGHAEFAQLLSFQSSDGPGPLHATLYPKPLGNHFFGDFLIPFRLAQQPSPYLADGILPFSYLPFSAVLLGPVILFNYWIALVLFLLLGLGLCLLACKRLASYLPVAMPFDELLLVVIASGPMVSMLDRGNLSLLLTGFCLVAVVELRRGNTISAAVCFGLAGAMKGYPLLFLAVFLRRRDGKSLVAGLVACLLSVCIPLVFYEGGFVENLRAMIHQFVSSSTPVHATKIRAYNNSFFSLFSSLGDAGQWLTDHYVPVFGFVAVVMLIIGTSKWASDFETLLICAVLMIFTPQTVGQYVLLLLLVPLLWLFSEHDYNRNVAIAICVVIGITMVPKGLPLNGPAAEWSPASITFTSTLNPLLGLVLLAICGGCALRRFTSDVLNIDVQDVTSSSRTDS